MMKEANLPSVIYQDAFYSEEQDVPERAREYAGKEFKLGSRTVPYLPDFDPTGTLAGMREKSLASSLTESLKRKPSRSVEGHAS
jgi:DNA polymerase zeta